MMLPAHVSTPLCSSLWFIGLYASGRDERPASTSASNNSRSSASVSLGCGQAQTRPRDAKSIRATASDLAAQLTAMPAVKLQGARDAMLRRFPCNHAPPVLGNLCGLVRREPP